ncbi:hypothetical protein BS17DRAFT_750664 [Gyrodon lividus]|nr:hypothetical protein BS17DRAFT_750664 [Gyrodon lividus]
MIFCVHCFQSLQSLSRSLLFTGRCWKERAGPNPAHQSDSLRNCSIEDDPAGQRLRKPLDGPLTLAMTENLGEYMSNQLDASRWYFASALHNGSVIPCWVYTSSHTSCFLAYDGNVITHTGPYCVLPYFKDRMELVAAAGGKIPAGRTPVEGGRDKEGRPLYHAIGVVNDSNGRAKMIGMAAEHLGGAVIVCWGKIHKISTGYEVLCWS